MSFLKGDPRGAAERIEEGIERYAGGDYSGAASYFESALELMPAHPRAMTLLQWVRDLMAGDRQIESFGIAGVEEALVVSDEDPLDKTSTGESPWDDSVVASLEPLEPPPSRPAAAQKGAHVDPLAGLDDDPITPYEVHIEDALQAPPAAAAKRPGTQTMSQPTTTGVRRSTLQGLPTPPTVRPAKQTDERPESVTREWPRRTTAPNLPPLPVPELSDDQIAELLQQAQHERTGGQQSRPNPTSQSLEQPVFELRLDDDDDEVDLQLGELDTATRPRAPTPPPIRKPSSSPSLPARPQQRPGSSPSQQARPGSSPAQRPPSSPAQRPPSSPAQQRPGSSSNNEPTWPGPSDDREASRPGQRPASSTGSSPSLQPRPSAGSSPNLSTRPPTSPTAARPGAVPQPRPSSSPAQQKAQPGAPARPSSVSQSRPNLIAPPPQDERLDASSILPSPPTNITARAPQSKSASQTVLGQPTPPKPNSIAPLQPTGPNANPRATVMGQPPAAAKPPAPPPKKTAPLKPPTEDTDDPLAGLSLDDDEPLLALAPSAPAGDEESMAGIDSIDLAGPLDSTDPFITRSGTEGKGRMQAAWEEGPGSSVSSAGSSYSSAPKPKPPGASTLLSQARMASERGDTAAALETALKALEVAGNDVNAAGLDKAALETIFLAALPLDRYPSHGKPSRDLDPKAAFLLSRLDGMLTIEEVLDISGMPRLETLRLLALLVQKGAVTLR